MMDGSITRYSQICGKKFTPHDDFSWVRLCAVIKPIQEHNNITYKTLVLVLLMPRTTNLSHMHDQTRSKIAPLS